MDKEMLEQFQLIIQGMSDMETRISKKIDDAETRINIKIENEVTKKIEFLFDGYKLVHEKQWELERQSEMMKAQIEDLQARLASLESKIA